MSPILYSCLASPCMEHTETGNGGSRFGHCGTYSGLRLTCEAVLHCCV